MKGRIKKAQLRHLNAQIALLIDKGQGLFIIAESLLHLHHRADAADHERIHILAGILHLKAVRGPARHVVDAVRQHDQVPSRLIQMLQNVTEEFRVQLLILKIRLQHAEHHGLLAACPLLLQRKFNREQIPADLPRKGLAQELAIFLRFLLGKRAEGLPQLRNNRSVLRRKTAGHPVNDAPALGHGLSDFLYFPAIHKFSLLLS